jgi:hypothetical protein
MVRKAVTTDLPIIENIYNLAREFMRLTGNPNQWGKTYPEKEIIKEDVARNRLYVIEREGKTVGVFMFEIGLEPTYALIDGAWLDDGVYGVIHRVAGLPEERGIFKELFDFANVKINHLRIDTHCDNKVMQAVLKKHGFVPCGVIYLENGDARIAFEYTEKNPSRS